jgi:hypothetical protein
VERGAERPILRSGRSGRATTGPPARSLAPLRYHLVIATDLDTGDEVVFARGPLKPALLASAALPGVFPIVEHDGRRLVDGGVVDSVPLWHALSGPVDRVFVFNVSAGPADREERSALDVVMTSFMHSRSQRFELEMRNVSPRVQVIVLPRPPDPRELFDFSGGRRAHRPGPPARAGRARSGVATAGRRAPFAAGSGAPITRAGRRLRAVRRKHPQAQEFAWRPGELEHDVREDAEEQHTRRGDRERPLVPESTRTGRPPVPPAPGASASVSLDTSASGSGAYIVSTMRSTRRPDDGREHGRSSESEYCPAPTAARRTPRASPRSRR